MRRDDACLDYSGGFRNANKPNQIVTYPCHGDKGNQEWLFTDVSPFKSPFLIFLFLSTFSIRIVFEIAIDDRSQSNWTMHGINWYERACDGSMRQHEIESKMELEIK